MAALGSQSIASSYEQILQVDRDGGGNSTTHVSVKDGDNGTTFGFTIASDALMMSSTNRLEFGDTGTYIHQSADGVLDLVSDTEIELNGTIDINGAVTMDGGNVTINDDSGDYDFRVESNGNANMFFVDGGADRVGVGTASPDYLIEIEKANGDHTSTALSITNSQSGGYGSALNFVSQRSDSSAHAVAARIRTQGNAAWDSDANTDSNLFFSTVLDNTITDRMAISGTAGDVDIETGDIFFSTAGKGICLGVTSNTDSNTLDDYEEGTWVGTFTDNTNDATMHATYRNGYYTKVGNLVHISGYFQCASLGSVSGNIFLKGLPFTCVNDSAGYSGIDVGEFGNLSITAGQDVTARTDINTTSLNLRLSDATTGNTHLQSGELTADGEIIIGGSYRVA